MHTNGFEPKVFEIYIKKEVFTESPLSSPKYILKLWKYYRAVCIVGSELSGLKEVYIVYTKEGRLPIKCDCLCNKCPDLSCGGLHNVIAGSIKITDQSLFATVC